MALILHGVYFLLVATSMILEGASSSTRRPGTHHRGIEQRPRAGMMASTREAIGATGPSKRPGHHRPKTPYSAPPAKRPGHRFNHHPSAPPVPCALRSPAAMKTRAEECSVTEDGNHGKMFYLYDFAAARLCLRGPELLDAAKRLNFERSQHLGAELFMQQQLEDDPMRTRDPKQASLFIVPSIFALVTMNVWSANLCKRSIEDVIEMYTEELLSSPYYQRSQGKDHMLVQTDWLSTGALLVAPSSGSPMIARQNVLNFRSGKADLNRVRDVLDGFRHATRHFVIGARFRNGACNRASLHRWAEPTARTLAVPYLDPAALLGCSAEQSSRRVQCLPALMGLEDTFEEYRERRNATLFFYGHTARVEEPPGAPRAGLRRLVVGLREDDPRWPRSFLAESRSPEASGLPPCAPQSPGGNRSAARCSAGPMEAPEVSRRMAQSLFALHVRGDDSSSSRFYQALSAGTPQLLLAPDFLRDTAAFRCRVDYERTFPAIDAEEFYRNPGETLGETLEELRRGGPEARAWRVLWTAQREAARELLWHVPGSRVARNLVEEAMRMLSSGAAGRLPPSWRHQADGL